MAQTDTLISPVKQIKLDYLMPGVSFELPIAKNSAIVMGNFFDIATDFSKFPKLKPNGLLTTPYLEYRRYFNLAKRVAKQPRWGNNSGEYVGLAADYTCNITHLKKTRSNVYIMYGFQRTYFNRLNIGANIGIGCSSPRQIPEIPVSFQTHFSIGYVLSPIRPGTERIKTISKK